MISRPKYETRIDRKQKMTIFDYEKSIREKDLSNIDMAQLKEVCIFSLLAVCDITEALVDTDDKTDAEIYDEISKIMELYHMVRVGK